MGECNSRPFKVYFVANEAIGHGLNDQDGSSCQMRYDATPTLFFTLLYADYMKELWGINGVWQSHGKRGACDACVS